jgi:hypothetical protein
MVNAGGCLGAGTAGGGFARGGEASVFGPVFGRALGYTR